jgi:hypothetical protein
MNTPPIRRLITHPALALGSTVLWGMVEWWALSRARWSASQRARRH